MSRLINEYNFVLQIKLQGRDYQFYNYDYAIRVNNSRNEAPIITLSLYNPPFTITSSEDSVGVLFTINNVIIVDTDRLINKPYIITDAVTQTLDLTFTYQDDSVSPDLLGVNKKLPFSNLKSGKQSENYVLPEGYNVENTYEMLRYINRVEDLRGFYVNRSNISGQRNLARLGSLTSNNGIKFQKVVKGVLDKKIDCYLLPDYWVDCGEGFNYQGVNYIIDSLSFSFSTVRGLNYFVGGIPYEI